MNIFGRSWASAICINIGYSIRKKKKKKKKRMKPSHILRNSEKFSRFIFFLSVLLRFFSFRMCIRHIRSRRIPIGNTKKKERKKKETINASKNSDRLLSTLQFYTFGRFCWRRNIQFEFDLKRPKKTRKPIHMQNSFHFFFLFHNGLIPLYFIHSNFLTYTLETERLFMQKIYLYLFDFVFSSTCVSFHRYCACSGGQTNVNYEQMIFLNVLVIEYNVHLYLSGIFYGCAALFLDFHFFS